MFRHEIKTAVSKSVLLQEIVRDAVAPKMNAARLAANHQPVSRFVQPVTNVVVVSVAERLIKQADRGERLDSIRGIPGADMIRIAFDRAVALLEIEIHGASRKRRRRIGAV